MKPMKKLIWIWLVLLGGISTLQAQYFGRNKPNYESFDFKVYQSPNFEIYYYLNDGTRRQDLTNYAEFWYRFIQEMLNDTIVGKNPLIFYNDHPDFQQTNAISGSVGVGTGGVTEAFKNRVIMPIALTNQATYQVLGHELVHAFQFNSILNGDSTSIQNLGNLPLWIVEGMAEYMSIGSVDPHTSMWMRDAVANNDIPSLKDMNNPKYFPYRYGHAFWVFLTGLKGDEIIKPFFKAVALYGVETAVPLVLNTKLEDFSKLWQDALRAQFQPFVANQGKDTPGKPILDASDGGKMNISPSISPDGKYVLFTSERNLFSTDVFMADVNTGKIIKTVFSTVRQGNIDNFDFLESSGAWSPNSKQIALVGFSKGQNILIIKDPFNGRTIKEGPIKGLPAFYNPAWSPDGKTLVVSGMLDGQTDLFLYDIRTEKLTRLTDDRYAEIHPTWTEDGQTIWFSTDQLGFERGRYYGRLPFSLAKMDLSTRATDLVDVFPGADNLNPQVDTAGNIIFLSNRDGYRNIYRYDPATQRVYQLTEVATGISGISQYSPAISVERRRDRILYTHYNNRGYEIFRARSKDMLDKEVDPQEVTFEAAKLPRVNPRINSLVDANVRESTDRAIPVSLTQVPFKSKFKLDYIGGGGGIGVGSSNTFGTTTGLAGAIDMLFGDILGDNQIFASLAMNGEISDFGGSIAYLNRKNKIQWGASLSHIPFRSGQGGFAGFDTIPVDGGAQLGRYEHWLFQVNRFFEDKVGVFAQLPLTSTFRFEVSADFSRYSESLVQFDNYYNAFGQLVYQDRTRLPSPSGFNLMSGGAAAVGDNSYFGMTAPLQGQRYRFGVQQYLGEFNFLAATADYRIYRYFKPVGFAFRGMHYGRYGKAGEQLFPLYLGSPWYVRGFNSGATEQLIVDGALNEDNLFGTKLLLSNFEVRIPFLGPEQLALIKSGFLFADLNFFIDGGLAWYDSAQFRPDDNLSGRPDAKALFSTGVSMRVNLFGSLILEPYYARPLVSGARWAFGLNLIPGW